MLVASAGTAAGAAARRAHPLWPVLAALAGLGAAALVPVDTATMATVLIPAVAVLAGTSCLVGARSARGGVRLGWRCMAAAILLWGVAFVLGSDWPGGQGGWLAARLLALTAIGVGLAIAPGVRRSAREWALLLLDGFMVAGSLLLTYLAVAVRPTGARSALAPDAGLPMLLVGLDLVATSVLFGLAQRTDRRDLVPVSAMVLGGALGSAADVAHLLAQPSTGFAPMSMVLWTGAIATLGVAPWCGRLDVFASAAPGTRPPSLTRLPHLMVGASGVLAIGVVAGDRRVDMILGVVGGALLLALVGQMALLQHENRDLYDSIVTQSDRFRALLQGSSDVIVTCTVDGRVSYVSAAVREVFGYDPEGFLDRNLLELLHPDDAPGLRRALEHLLESGEAPVRLSGRLLDAHGQWRHAESTVNTFPDSGGRTGLILNTRDVTARVELEEELRRRASHDELTGLLNRRAFTSRLTARLDAGRPGRLGVLFVDLDDFKAVNDTAGHVVGDALLVEVARRLCAAVRTDDLVARFGGDEFVALIEGSGPGDILAAAERLRTALSGPYDVASEEIATRASIGVAVAGPAATADELLRNADLAMYRAKAGGRDRTELYVPEMHAEAVHRFALAGELRHAVEAELLELRYQPIVDLADGHVRRLEALLRWRRPDGTEVAPWQFVPIAEQAGLIVPLGRWVLREALREVAGWRLHGLSVGIAVNLSARQLDDPELVDDVARALAEHGVPACALLLEVTENVLVDNLARSSERLAALRALGVGVALDDFGTGFSSLGYLSRLPVDVLKVDRSFVAALGRDEDGAALVRTIMALAADLRLETVAEGVETPAQLETLRALGYHSAQGFVFARPQPADAVEPLVRAGFGTLVAPGPRLRTVPAP